MSAMPFVRSAHAPRRVFLAIGRKEVGAFAAAPQHNYLIRSVDPVEPPLNVPHAVYSWRAGRSARPTSARC